MKSAGKSNRYTDAFLVILLVLAFLASLSLEKWRILDQQTHFLNQHVTEVNKQLDRLLFFPRVLASDPRFISVLQNSSDEIRHHANTLLEEITQISGAAFVFIMDPEGNTVASGNWQSPDSFIGKNYGFRPYFRQAIEGNQATYYAVGATTGQPGFFIANPILKDSQPLGVIVVKIHLESLQDSWGRLDYDIALFDELDVAILSSRPDFLYVPFSDIPGVMLERIEREKRYDLSESAQFLKKGGNKVVFNDGERTTYLTVNQATGTEPWRIRLFYPQSRYWLNIGLFTAVLCGVFLLIFLVLRLFRQQKFIAQVERNHALELEAKVAQRTTQLQSAQQQLILQSNYAMLGKMSAAINHEINQPLTSLRFNLASLRQLLDQQPLQLGLVNQIATESDLTTKRISRVMETLRSISKTANTDFSTVDLNELLRDTVSTVRRERPNISQYLSVETIDQPISAKGNFVLLQQAILNLLSNGFDAVIKTVAPKILLGLKLNDHSATISVTDNGDGVSPQMTSCLFEEYATGKSGKKGLGLGLALSNQIAIDHNGRLAYDPVASGGSRFSIEIPLLEEERD